MKKTEDLATNKRLENPPVQAENPAFKSNETIACAECARANPPTRARCLYCGAQMEISEAQSEFLKANLRPLEAWEKGFNLIFAPGFEDYDESKIERAAAFLNFEPKVLRQIVDAKKPLPLARVETETDAEIVRVNLFETANIETKIVADADLMPNNPPRRLRGMDFLEDKLVLILFNGDEIAEINWTDLVLIVSGAIFERRVAEVEARGKRGENKILDANETASDEILIDIYSCDNRAGFRVEQKGFDFSCLGAEKSLLVAENLRALVKRLSTRAPDAKIVEDYLQVRAALAAVWTVEERTDARGVKRERFGAFSRENLTIINNSAQFTKYSRLCRHLL